MSRTRLTPSLLIALVVLQGCSQASVLLAQHSRRTPRPPGKSTKEVLTNQSVTRMVKAGIGTDLILAKINESEVNFDLTTDGMIALKTANVSDEVIRVMRTKQLALPVGANRPKAENNPLGAVDTPRTEPSPRSSNESSSQAAPVSVGTSTPKLSLELVRELNSGTVVLGDAVPFVVVEEVMIEGKSLIAKATPAVGSIKTLKPKSRWHDATLELDDFAQTKDVTGRDVVIKIDTQTDSAFTAGFKTLGKSAKGLFKSGKDIIIPAGARVEGFISSIGQTALGSQSIPAPRQDRATTTVAGPRDPSPTAPSQNSRPASKTSQSAAPPVLSRSQIVRRIVIKAAGVTVDGQEMPDKELDDSARDLRSAAAGRQFAVVEVEAGAGLKLVVLQREVKQAQPSLWKHKTARVENTLHAAFYYKDGDQWKPVRRLTNSSTVWRVAADHMMKEVERWVEQGR